MPRKPRAKSVDDETLETLLTPGPSAAEHAQQFLDLHQRFIDAERGRPANLERLRRKVTFAWAAQAGLLLCEAWDRRSIPRWLMYTRWMRLKDADGKSFALDLPEWDLRVILDDAWRQSWWACKLVRLRQAARDKREIAAVNSLPRMIGSEVPALTAEMRDALPALTWYAAIRWWLADAFPERFPADLRRTFHPWVDDFRPPHGTGVSDRAATIRPLLLAVARGAPSLNAASEDLFRSWAEVQGQACALLADICGSNVPQGKAADEMTLTEAWNEFGVPVPVLSKAAKAERLPHRHEGRNVYVRREHVQHFARNYEARREVKQLSGPDDRLSVSAMRRSKKKP